MSTPAWYNPAWLYRRAITVDNTANASALTNYQVLITLTSTDFTFAHAQTNGQDLRFTADDGVTLLSAWAESYNASSQSAVLYVNVPTIPASSTTTLYLYYGNPSASSAFSAHNTFAFYDAFDSPFGGPVVLHNATTYQTTPTYDGSGQVVHPSVVEFASPWHGYTYWMAITPYPGGNAFLENPSILASNDGATWVVPSGVTNPLAPAPVCDHNNDPDLLYDAATDSLWLYYLDTNRAAECSACVGQPFYNHNYLLRMTSADGVTWSAPQVVIDWDLGTNPLYLSPSVAYDGTVYHLWVTNRDTYVVSHATSTDGLSWGMLAPVSLSAPAWHIDVLYVPTKSQFWMVANYPSLGGSLTFATSWDGVTWTTYPNPMLSPTTGWDANLYRSSILYEAATDTLRLWYSAYNASKVWHLGYASATYAQFLSSISTDGWAVLGSGTWASSNAEAKRGPSSGRLIQTTGTSMLMAKPAPLASGFTLEWDLYDDMDTTAFKIVRAGDAAGNKIGIGVWTGSNATHYVYHAMGYIYTATSIARATGWHKFGLRIAPDASVAFFIDGAQVGILTSQFADTTTISIEGYYGGPTTYYVDDVRVRQYTNPEPLATIGAEATS